ncbi:glycosyltransferase family 2 protein [Haloarchaeobius amylolyticus]|uniref:Glycosyltransferase family 2 protein n=1 Tax=Haloarchaeobius amylolyticus TaxID=1198296 RepID=A0ABD6BCN7_9EURY
MPNQETKSGSPLVSVTICSYNAEDFLENTLRSVIKQTYSNMEILVLDNNSTDGTRSILREYEDQDDRIEVFYSNENKGAFRGLNHLIEICEGEYIAIQDHDDIWHPEKIERQVEALENNEQYIGCGTNLIKLFENEDKVAFRQYSKCSKVVPHTSLMFRNEGFYYDSSIGYKTDVYFMKYILCSENRNLYVLQDALSMHLVRSDNNNLSKKWTKGIPRNVIRYFNATGEFKTLCWGIIAHLLPDAAINRVKYQILDFEFQNIATIAEDNFTRPYLGYIKSYCQAPEK